MSALSWTQHGFHCVMSVKWQGLEKLNSYMTVRRNQKRKDALNKEKAVNPCNHSQNLPQILLSFCIVIVIVTVSVIVEAEDLQRTHRGTQLDGYSKAWLTVTEDGAVALCPIPVVWGAGGHLLRGFPLPGPQTAAGWVRRSPGRSWRRLGRYRAWSPTWWEGQRPCCSRTLQRGEDHTWGQYLKIKDWTADHNTN